ncbi:MAG: hypothetical protein KDD45_00105 [Bdellovibrionales bacterium]|nr:hypothetical protein [Bdellovibrionales bacterium]
MKAINRSYSAILNELVVRAGFLSVPFIMVHRIFINSNIDDAKINIFIVLYLIMSLLYLIIPCLIFLFTIFQIDNVIRPNSIILKSSDGAFKKIMDSFLGRHQIFKNSPRNLSVFKSIYVFCNLGTLFIIILSSLISILGFLQILGMNGLISGLFNFNIHVSFVDLSKASFLFVSVVVAIYWRISKNYEERWKYCADKYYNLIKLEASTCKSNYQDINNFEVSLAIDILQLDLWAKRGFEQFFKEALKNCSKQKGGEVHLVELKNKVYSALENGREIKYSEMISEAEAEYLLKKSFY